MRARTLQLLGALLTSAACSGPGTGPEPSASRVTAAADPGGVKITNSTPEPIYYAALEANFAARVAFVACTDPPRCRSVPAHSTRVIPTTAIGGYEPGARAVIIHYWHLRPYWHLHPYGRLRPAPGGGFVVVNLQSIIVPL